MYVVYQTVKTKRKKNRYKLLFKESVVASKTPV